MGEVVNLTDHIREPYILVESGITDGGAPITLISVVEDGAELIIWTSENRGTADEVIADWRADGTRIVDRRSEVA